MAPRPPSFLRASAIFERPKTFHHCPGVYGHFFALPCIFPLCMLNAFTDAGTWEIWIVASKNLIRVPPSTWRHRYPPQPTRSPSGILGSNTLHSLMLISRLYHSSLCEFFGPLKYNPLFLLSLSRLHPLPMNGPGYGGLLCSRFLTSYAPDFLFFLLAARVSFCSGGF